MQEVNVVCCDVQKASFATRLFREKIMRAIGIKRAFRHLQEEEQSLMSNNIREQQKPRYHKGETLQALWSWSAGASLLWRHPSFGP